MTRSFMYIILFCLATFAASAQTFDTCLVSGTYYGQDLRPSDSVCIDVIRIIKDGTIWSTRRATYCTDSTGYVEIPLPKSSVAYLYSSKAQGFTGAATGKAITIPNSSTASLITLTPATAPPPQYVIALSLSGDTSAIGRYLDSNRVQKGFVTLSKVYSLLSTFSADDTSWAGLIRILDETTAALGIEIDTVQSRLDAHKARTDNPHGVTASQAGALSISDYNIFLADLAADQAVQDSTLAAQVAALAVDDDTIQGRLDAHKLRTDNPHGVTAAQTGAASTAALSDTVKNMANGASYPILPVAVKPGTNGQALLTTAGVSAWGDIQSGLPTIDTTYYVIQDSGLVHQDTIRLSPMIPGVSPVYRFGYATFKLLAKCNNQHQWRIRADTANNVELKSVRLRVCEYRDLSGIASIYGEYTEYAYKWYLNGAWLNLRAPSGGAGGGDKLYGSSTAPIVAPLLTAPPSLLGTFEFRMLFATAGNIELISYDVEVTFSLPAGKTSLWYVKITDF